MCVTQVDRPPPPRDGLVLSIMNAVVQLHLIQFRHRQHVAICIMLVLLSIEARLTLMTILHDSTGGKTLVQTSAQDLLPAQHLTGGYLVTA